MQSTFSQRFGELLGYFKLTPTEVARLTNLKRQTVDNLVKKGNPEYGSIAAILQYFHNVNARWLILGDGLMFSPNTSGGTFVNEQQTIYSLPEKERIEKLWMEDRQELSRLRDLNHSLMNELSKVRETNHSLMEQIAQLKH